MFPVRGDGPETGSVFTVTTETTTRGVTSLDVSLNLLESLLIERTDAFDVVTALLDLVSVVDGGSHSPREEGYFGTYYPAKEEIGSKRVFYIVGCGC